eukprot:SAG11_NODE_3609_length_2342_cov_1.734730_1_plen_48_part_00
MGECYGKVTFRPEVAQFSIRRNEAARSRYSYMYVIHPTETAARASYG